MNLHLYCVFDSTAAVYTAPTAMVNHPTAIRSFKSAVDEPGHAYNMHPMDYTLFCIGLYDDQTADIEIFDKRVSLGSAAEYANRGKSDD